MNWHHLLSADMEKWAVLAIFIISFALILVRKIPIQYIALVGATPIIVTGIVSCLSEKR